MKAKAEGMEHIDWDTQFMMLAYITAMRSKDPSTQVGCVIVSEDKRVLRTGYNGLTIGMEDTDEFWRPEEKADKYLFAEHAERNAIYNATKSGVTLKGSTVYVPWAPCSDCMRAIIQSGIREVVIHSKHPGMLVKNNWNKSNERGKLMAKRRKVTIRMWDGVLPNINIRFSGNNFENKNGRIKQVEKSQDKKLDKNQSLMELK